MREVQAIENKKTHSKLKIILSAIISVFIVCIITILSIYNFRNYKLYKYIVSNDSEQVDIYYNFNYMLIWNKTINYIKENKNVVRFIGCDYFVSITSYNFSYYYNFIIKAYDELSNNDKFSNVISCIVDLSKFQDTYAIKNIVTSLSTDMSRNSFVDIYKYDNDEIVLYKKCVHVNEGKVSFEIVDECRKYIIVNVPLQDIDIENDSLEIKNNTSLSLLVKTIPENATIDKFKFRSDSDNLVITSDGTINAKEAGSYKVEISDYEEKVKKEIILVVIPVALEIKVDKSSISLQVDSTTKINASVLPENAINKDIIFESTDINIATVDDNGNVKGIKEGKCEIKIKTKEAPIVEAVIPVEVTKKITIINGNNAELTYINGVLIANKKYSLPSDYNPGVDATALSAYYVMKNAAKQNGFSLDIMSGFRSYETQRGLYNRYVATYGKAEADTFSAEPGKSEHQTGLAFDLGWVDDNYAYTDEGKWLANNCYKYGFIIRYPKGKEEITGYKYEPWHVRYLGNPLATDVYNSGLCLEEYLGI